MHEMRMSFPRFTRFYRFSHHFFSLQKYGQLSPLIFAPGIFLIFQVVALFQDLQNPLGCNNEKWHWCQICSLWMGVYVCVTQNEKGKHQESPVSKVIKNLHSFSSINISTKNLLSLFGLSNLVIVFQHQSGWRVTSALWNSWKFVQIFIQETKYLIIHPMVM